MSTAPAADPADQGGGGGADGGGAASFPALFPTPESPASESGSDTSESSSTSSSSGAILALGDREEADSRDELIGIFVPALDPDPEGERGGGACPPPFFLGEGDRKVNDNGELEEVRPDMSASSSTSCSAMSASNNSNSARRMVHHRALSSTCLEGLEPANYHLRRERSGSLLGE